MSLSTEEIAEIEAAIAAGRAVIRSRLSSGGAAQRISHTGGTTSREIEFNLMSSDEIRKEIRHLERELGRGCSRRPMYP